MTVTELIEYLVENCSADAKIKIAWHNTLYDAEFVINSELSVVLTVKGVPVSCVVCSKMAVATPFANQFVCYEHWYNFKETE